MLPIPLLPLVCAAIGPHPHGTTWFVRNDGGTAEQCDGKTDAPLAAAGAGRACAFDHPAAALRAMAGGDRVILGAGVYRVGPDLLPPLPSGPDAARPTRLIGRPGARLEGAERVALVVNLSGTSHAELACLEISDASECIEKHGGNLRCPEAGDWAGTAIAGGDTSDVTLRSLDIHGMASAGIIIARFSDWTVEDVSITANGLVGWQGDGGGGANILRRVSISWNGCSEDAQRRPIGCFSRTAGGWGAGLAASMATGAWRIEDSRFQRNTDVGLDLMHDGRGAIVLDRVRADGNGATQIRARGEVLVKDSVIAASCRVWKGAPEAFHIDVCAGGGAALALEPVVDRTLAIRGSTISGDGRSLLDLVAPVAEREDRLRAGQPRDACRRLRPVVVERTTFTGNGQPLVYRECGGIEGAGPELVNRESTIKGVKER